MATKNDITGASIVSRPSNDLYRTQWDYIFGNKPTDQVYIMESDGFIHIIVDYHNNPNNFLRLTPEQFDNLMIELKRNWS